MAVVMLPTTMDLCRWARITHILNTTGDDLDVVVLHAQGSIPVPSSLMHNKRLTVAKQPETPPAWKTFSQRTDGATTSSGLSKQAFLGWLIGSGYEFAWHLEDDVEYTGSWGRLLRLLAPSFQDLVSCDQYVKVDKKHRFAVSGGEDINQGCFTAPGLPCIDDPRLQGEMIKTRWPLLGMSSRLAASITKGMESGMRGHHETLTAAVCRLQGWCGMAGFPSVCLGRFSLDGFGPYNMNYYHALARNASSADDALAAWANLGVDAGLLPNKLYHPAKCPDHANYPAPHPPGGDIGGEPCVGTAMSVVQQALLVGDESSLDKGQWSTGRSQGHKHGGEPAFVLDDGKEYEDLGVAVCITGQLSRLELSSKVENLLAPLNVTHGRVKAFAVLEKGGRIFSRRPSNQDEGCLDEPRPESVRRLLGDYLADADFPEHVAFHPDISQWPNYSLAWHGEDRDGRARNLANLQAQQEHVNACAEMIESHEQKVGGRFHTVVRVRENTLVVKPFALPTIGHAFPLPGVIVKGCNSAGGLNDKVAVAPRGLMRAFQAVALAMRRQAEGEAIPGNIGSALNAETMLKSAFDATGVPYTRVTAEDLPMVDGRCHAAGPPQAGGTNKHFCLLGVCKDCEPAEVDRQRYPVCSPSPCCKDKISGESVMC